MREKIREYIIELNTEIKRVEQCIIDNGMLLLVLTICY